MTKILNNRYQIIKTLGSGGFGDTFLAKDTHLPSQKYCVIKQLKPVINNAEMTQLTEERFAREAAILEDLGEHNSQIPKLYAYFSDKKQFYLIQEYIEGETLTKVVEKQGKLKEEIVKQILCNLLPVLDYIHSRGIVHRDIKPDNIILRNNDNLPVLIDFGAVKETMGTIVNNRGNYTNSIIIGTPGFMPPEQSIGRPVFSSDLYSLSLVAVYLLTGKLPQEIPTNPRNGEFIFDQFTNNISPHLIDVLKRAINEHPQNRFQTAKEMLKALTNNSINSPNNSYIAPTVKMVAPTEVADIPDENKLGMWVIFITIIIGGIFGLNLLFSMAQQAQNKANVKQNNQEIVTNEKPNIEPEIVTKIERPSVEKALFNYYETLNNGDYQTGWNLLSEESRNNKNSHPNGYQSYLDWWKQVKKVDILATNIIEENEQVGIIDSKLKYQLISGKIVEQSLIFSFLWSETEQKWLLNKVERISEKVINNINNNSPVDFVKNYYQMVNEKKYETTWQKLSKDFTTNKVKNDYSSYLNWWKSVTKVEITEVKLISHNNEKAILETKLKYSMKNGKIGYDKLKISLIKDREKDDWLIENTVNIK